MPIINEPSALDTPTVSMTHAAAKTAAMMISMNTSKPRFRATQHVDGRNRGDHRKRLVEGRRGDLWRRTGREDWDRRQDRDGHEVLIDHHSQDSLAVCARTITALLHAGDADSIRTHRQAEADEEGRLPGQGSDRDQQPGNDAGREQILRCTQTKDEATHRQQSLRLAVEPHEKQEQHHPDLADRLQLIDMTGEQWGRCMRTQRHPDGKQRHRGAQLQLVRYAASDNRRGDHHCANQHDVISSHVQGYRAKSTQER
jgi:hypothetical protein